ncbi:glycoside hydrolase family 44 protein [Luedemannella flava]|uniref:glycoside hydrolase family 44 protein n=1 Tax=Luedemannella flava TaxID=349316 RepID=UPI0031D29210
MSHRRSRQAAIFASLSVATAATAVTIALPANATAGAPRLAAAASTAAPISGTSVPGPGLSVNTTVATKPISPDIYGMNFADEALAQELRLPLRRWGGNATTRYNYLNDTSNRASDWYFENIAGTADPATLPAGSDVNAFVDQDKRTGTKSLLTVPLIGWVPKSRAGDCGFSVAKYGPQQQTDQWRPDCGNGVKPDGTNITGNDPRDTSVAAGADYVGDWVTYLKGRYGSLYYNLDNEPDIWHATHRDVHPDGASYDELRDRTIDIAGAVKAADANAKTLGPAGWGWNSLTMSGKDQQTCSIQGGSCWSNPPDRNAHGGTDFGAWYLQQLKAYDDAHGTRLLDYYDNHWYPQGTGVAFGNANDPATNALRLRSTRNLWDPTYVDESWINTQTQLIPRMKALVSANYPGTKTAITEYNWGALDSVNGALAQADVLGIFGREGLDLATLWSPPTSQQPGAYAFRMFLNFDGRGARVGSQSVRATSSDQDKLAIYATRDATGPLKLVIINKTNENLSSSVGFTGGASALSAQVYRYSAANPTAIVRGADLPVAVAPVCVGCTPYSSMSGIWPANSISTVVLGNADGTPPTSPGPPTVTNINPHGFTVTWGPATDNYGVAGYLVQLGKQGMGTIATVNVTSGLTHTFDDLEPGAGYTVAVAAYDAAGNTSNYIAHGIIYFLPTAGPPTSAPPPTCVVTYKILAQWPGGFQAEVTVRNAGQSSYTGWSVDWTFANGQQVTQLWNGTVSQAGAAVKVRNVAWNGQLAPGGSRTFGFLGSWTGTNAAPTPTCAGS